MLVPGTVLAAPVDLASADLSAFLFSEGDGAACVYKKLCHWLAPVGKWTAAEWGPGPGEPCLPNGARVTNSFPAEGPGF